MRRGRTVLPFTPVISTKSFGENGIDSLAFRRDRGLPTSSASMIA